MHNAGPPPVPLFPPEQEQAAHNPAPVGDRIDIPRVADAFPKSSGPADCPVAPFAGSDNRWRA
ncbi:hypothetical protein GCM10010176_066310 [Nonomuraea spiralis]|nr:hypothetical protein GCM10010176_066310 [Nonomuraea spiralis]